MAQSRNQNHPQHPHSNSRARRVSHRRARTRLRLRKSNNTSLPRDQMAKQEVSQRGAIGRNDLIE